MVIFAINMYERGFSIMGKGKKNNNKENSSEDSNESKNQSKSKENGKLKIFQYIITGINSLISAGFIIFLITFYGDFRELKAHVDTIKEDYVNKSDLENITDKINSFESDLNGIGNIQSSATVYVPTKKVSGLIYDATISKNDLEFLSSPQWNEDDIIAKNPNTGRKYKPQNLKDKKILLPYSENGQDIYFYGQFNKYNHWDGKCIINVYKNNKLQIIMEGQYTDGKLISYKRVTHRENTRGIKIWSISKREVNGNINTGETYTYFKTKNKKAHFTQNTIESSDILSIIDFQNWLNTPLEGYYKGNTSNGNYNDETGNAYLIKYFEDGTTRTVYCGNFKNGMFNDHTGKAWYVSIDEGAKNYIYFKGGFTNNTPDETKNHKRVDIDNEDIHEIIDDMKFNSSINLRGDEDSTM